MHPEADQYLRGRQLPQVLICYLGFFRQGNRLRLAQILPDCTVILSKLIITVTRGPSDESQGLLFQTKSVSGISTHTSTITNWQIATG